MTDGQCPMCGATSSVEGCGSDPLPGCPVMAEINDEIAAGVFERFGQEVMGVARLDGEGDGAYLERLGRMMASQRDDVRASLLASHDRDAVVRRKVADQVHEVVATGAREVASEAASEVFDGCEIIATPETVATAAAAVVLASDLRAPVETRSEWARRVMAKFGPLDVIGREVEEDIPAGAPMEVNPATGKVRVARRDEDGYYPTKIDTAAELAAAHESAKAWMGRERLVAVQRLLGASFDAPTRRQSDEAVSDALSIVRSLLGGE